MHPLTTPRAGIDPQKPVPNIVTLTTLHNMGTVKSPVNISPPSSLAYVPKQMWMTPLRPLAWRLPSELTYVNHLLGITHAVPQNLEGLHTHTYTYSGHSTTLVSQYFDRVTPPLHAPGSP